MRPTSPLSSTFDSQNRQASLDPLCACIVDAPFVYSPEPKSQFYRQGLLAAQVLIRGDPEVKVSVTSCRDIARWLPKILLDPTSRNATVNVCSQELSLREAVECFEEVSGKIHSQELETVFDIRERRRLTLDLAVFVESTEQAK